MLKQIADSLLNAPDKLDTLADELIKAKKAELSEALDRFSEEVRSGVLTAKLIRAGLSEPDGTDSRRMAETLLADTVAEHGLERRPDIAELLRTEAGDE